MAITTDIALLCCVRAGLSYTLSHADLRRLCEEGLITDPHSPCGLTVRGYETLMALAPGRRAA